VLDLAAAQASREDARATVLTLEQERDRQRLELKKAVGVLPETELPIDQGVGLPSDLPLPSEGELVANLENRRPDLLVCSEGFIKGAEESDHLASRPQPVSRMVLVRRYQVIHAPVAKEHIN
jgi:hypothetical protein